MEPRIVDAHAPAGDVIEPWHVRGVRAAARAERICGRRPLGVGDAVNGADRGAGRRRRPGVRLGPAAVAADDHVGDGVFVEPQQIIGRHRGRRGSDDVADDVLRVYGPLDRRVVPALEIDRLPRVEPRHGRVVFFQIERLLRADHPPMHVEVAVRGQGR